MAMNLSKSYQELISCCNHQVLVLDGGFNAVLQRLNLSEADFRGQMFADHYKDARFVQVAPLMGEGVLPEQFIPADTLAGTNNMQLFVYGNDDRIMITTRFDNLGKGGKNDSLQPLKDEIDELKKVIQKEKLEEEIFLGFRKTEGVNVEKIREKFDVSFEKKYKSILDKYSGYIIKTECGYAFNLKGTMLSNEILPEFLSDD